MTNRTERTDRTDRTDRTEQAEQVDRSAPADSSSGTAADGLPADALKQAGQRLLGVLAERAARSATARVDQLSERLTDVASGSGGIGSLLGGGNGKGGGLVGSMVRGGVGHAVGQVTDKIKGAVGLGNSGSGSGSNGGGRKAGKVGKVTNIVETIDVGLPLRTTYDLWTQFSDFPSFMKKVESVEQVSDEETDWKAQVFWSHRTWHATISEQVPDSHIVWRSKGAKGHVDGAVTFSELAPNLTRVLLVLEYWPQGMFEHTGNLWRAQGRRARLELKHFRRHAMTRVLLAQDEVAGWRGEIRDGEVVRSHEDALEAEQTEQTEQSADDETGTTEAKSADETASPERDTEQDTERDEAYEEPFDDEYDEEPNSEDDREELADDVTDEEDDDRYADEYDDYDDEYGPEYEAEEDEDERVPDGGRSRRREPAAVQRRGSDDQ